jgi:hypothetical protein
MGQRFAGSIDEGRGVITWVIIALVGLLLGFILPTRVTVGLLVLAVVCIVVSTQVDPKTTHGAFLIEFSFAVLGALPTLALAGLARAAFKKFFSTDAAVSARWELK